MHLAMACGDYNPISPRALHWKHGAVMPIVQGRGVGWNTGRAKQKKMRTLCIEMKWNSLGHFRSENDQRISVRPIYFRGT